jgi:hypothetical protein
METFSREDTTDVQYTYITKSSAEGRQQISQVPSLYDFGASDSPEYNISLINEVEKFNNSQNSDPTSFHFPLWQQVISFVANYFSYCSCNQYSIIERNAGVGWTNFGEYLCRSYHPLERPSNTQSAT